MTGRYRHPCLYCGDNERERTREHVIQQSLGGGLVLEDDVCAHCNTDVFSPIDKHLVDYLRTFVFWREPFGNPMALLTGGPLSLTFDEVRGVWQSVRVDSKGFPRAVPQFVFKTDSQVQFFADCTDPNRAAALQAQMLAELKSPSTLSIKPMVAVKRPADPRPEVQTALIRSAPNTYLVRASSTALAEQMMARILSDQLFSAWEQVGELRDDARQISIEKSIQVRVGDVHRAVAKIALNFVCAVAGPDIARDGALDELRHFALRGNLDETPVSEVWNAEEKDILALTTERRDKHSILLTVTSDALVACVAFYGRLTAAVRLTERSMPVAMTLGVFDYCSSTHSFEDEVQIARHVIRAKS